MFRVDSWPFHKPSIGVPKGVSRAAGATLDRYTANVRSLQRQIRGSLTGRSQGGRRTRCRGLTQSARRCDRRLCTYGVTVYKRGPYKPRRGYARRTYSARTRPREQCIFLRDIGARANRATIFAATSELARTPEQEDGERHRLKAVHNYHGEFMEKLGLTPRKLD